MTLEVIQLSTFQGFLTSWRPKIEKDKTCLNGKSLLFQEYFKNRYYGIKLHFLKVVSTNRRDINPIRLNDKKVPEKTAQQFQFIWIDFIEISFCLDNWIEIKT